MRALADAIVAVRHSLHSQGSYRHTLLLALAAVVAAGLIARLGLQVHRLLFEPQGPIDLLIYHRLIHGWFEGLPIYAQRRTAVHPPALFLLLWPIYGWLPAEATRWLYALTVFPVLGAFAAILLREAHPARRSERALLTLLVVGCYPSAITIGIGQITLYVLLAAIAGTFLVLREPPDAARDAVAAALFLVALIKPNLTMPFFWVIAFRKGGIRPVVLALVGYFVATAVAMVLHGTSLDAMRALLLAWYFKGQGGFSTTGYGNLHSWLGDLGLNSWIFPASGVVFAAHGLWAWRHRDADPWVLIGVAAIVARIWAYHRLYDDLLLIFPLVALYRLAGNAPEGEGAGAWLLFALGAAALIGPATLLVESAAWGLAALWFAQLLFLMRRARPSPARAPAVSAA